MSSYYLRLAALRDEWLRASSLHVNSAVFFGLTLIGQRIPDDEFQRRREEHEFDCLRDVADAENDLFDLEAVRREGWFDAEVRVHSRVLARRERVAKLKRIGAWYGRPTELEFGWRYWLDGVGDGLSCRYCERPAKGWDHVPALDVVARMAEGERDATQCVVVRCCAGCNRKLSRLDLRTVEARTTYLRDRQRRPARSSGA